MGLDDGVCDQAPDGVHELVLTELVGNDTGLIDRVHRCSWCGATAYDAEADQEAARRPPL